MVLDRSTAPLEFDYLRGPVRRAALSIILTGKKKRLPGASLFPGSLLMAYSSSPFP